MLESCCLLLIVFSACLTQPANSREVQQPKVNGPNPCHYVEGEVDVVNQPSSETPLKWSRLSMRHAMPWVAKTAWAFVQSSLFEPLRNYWSWMTESSQLYFFRERGSSRGLLWALRCQLWCQETSGGNGCTQSLGIMGCGCWQAREEPRTCPWAWWCGMGTFPLLPLSCFQGLAVTWGWCRVTSPTWC